MHLLVEAITATIASDQHLDGHRDACFRVNIGMRSVHVG